MNGEASARLNVFTTQCSIEALPNALAQQLEHIMGEVVASSSRTEMPNTVPTSELDTSAASSDTSDIKVAAKHGKATARAKKINNSKSSPKEGDLSLNPSRLHHVGALGVVTHSDCSAALTGKGLTSVGMASPSLSARLGDGGRRKERPLNPVTCPDASMIDRTASNDEVAHYFKRALTLIVQAKNQEQENNVGAIGSFCQMHDDSLRSEILRCLSAVASVEHPLHASYANFLLSRCYKERQQAASFERHLLIQQRLRKLQNATLVQHYLVQQECCWLTKLIKAKV